MQRSQHRSDQNLQLLVLLGAWCLVHCFIFVKIGVQPILESLKYINAANHLLNTGELPGIRYFFYLITTLTIAACLKLKLGFTGVVMLQMVLNVLSVIFFFKALSRIQKNRHTAFITALLLVACIPYHLWNVYLYTESIFYSFTLLFFSACLYFQKLSISKILLQGFFLCGAILSRPLGVLLLPCWIIYLIVTVEDKKIRTGLYLISLGSAVIFSLITNTILQHIQGWEILQPAEKGYIICDVPSTDAMDLGKFKNRAPLLQVSSYILQHPMHFAELAAKRLKAFLLLTREYYSNIHNLGLLLLAGILYIPFIANLFLGKLTINQKPGWLLSIALVSFFSLAIMVQCDDYHNRFHHALIPVFLYAGIFRFLDKRHITNDA